MSEAAALKELADDETKARALVTARFAYLRKRVTAEFQERNKLADQQLHGVNVTIAQLRSGKSTSTFTCTALVST